MSNTYKIDSFRCRIPMDQVRVINPDLVRTTQKFNVENGEVLQGTERRESYLYGYDESDPYEKFHHDPGKPFDNLISCKFQVQSVPVGCISVNGRKVPNYQECLVVSVSSKLLKGEYFTGINISNIFAIYDHLMSCRIAEFTFPAFLQSQVVDVDVCRDVLCSTSLDDIADYVKKYSKYPDLIQVYRKSTNKGIQFSRRTEGTVRIPYMKLYNKRVQMEHESTDSGFRKNREFAEYYLGGISAINKDLIRYELNLRNKDHLSNYELPNHLGELLKVRQEQFQEIQADYWKRWMHLPNSVELKPRKKRASAKTSISEGILLIYLYEHFAGKFPDKAEVYSFGLSVITEKWNLFTGKPMRSDTFKTWKDVRLPYVVDALMLKLADPDTAEQDMEINSAIEVRRQLFSDLRLFGIPVLDYPS